MMWVMASTWWAAAAPVRSSGRREVPDRAQRSRGDRARRATHPRRHRAAAPLPAARGRGRRARLAARGTDQGHVAGREAEARRESCRVPLPRRKGGQLTVSAKARGVELHYADGGRRCPKSTPRSGLEGARLTIDAARGRGHRCPAREDPCRDRRSARRAPAAGGRRRGRGSDANFLRFIDASPVAGWIDHATAGAQAAGDGRLGLNLRFPLGDHAGNKVSGEYQFIGKRTAPGRRAAADAVERQAGVHRGRGPRAGPGGRGARGPRPALDRKAPEGETRVTGAARRPSQRCGAEFESPYGAALSGTSTGRSRRRSPAGLAWTARAT